MDAETVEIDAETVEEEINDVGDSVGDIEGDLSEEHRAIEQLKKIMVEGRTDDDIILRKWTKTFWRFKQIESMKR